MSGREIAKSLLFIRLSILKGEPVSFVRIGDGEAILMAGYDKKRCNKILEKHVGRGMDPISFAAFRQEYKNVWRKMTHLTWHKTLGRVTTRVENIIKRTKPTFYISPFRRGLATPASIKSFLNGIEHLTLLGSYDGQAAFQEILGPKVEVDWIEIPGRHRDMVRKVLPRRSMSLSYKQIIAQTLPKIVVRKKGHVFLVGAGIMKPFYCARIQELGGIAIDVGSVMDHWYGRETRGPKKDTKVVSLMSQIKMSRKTNKK